MVDDNDLALGRILDKITHSKFWDGGKDDAMNKIIWFYKRGEHLTPEQKNRMLVICYLSA
jgi:hypothetical protein